MEHMESLFRTKNIRFFLLLPSVKTIKTAVKVAKISQQHATRLISLWKSNGWIERGNEKTWKYMYTTKGEKIADMLRAFGSW